jgi:hypothetical protein
MKENARGMNLHTLVKMSARKRNVAKRSVM